MQNHCSTEKVCYKSLDFMGHPNYRVGSDGSFWKRVKGKWEKRKTTKLKHKVKYHVVGTYTNKKLRNHYIHRLVLLAFVGKCPIGMESRHIDGNPDNNKLSNLSWGTKKQNGEDRVKHKTTQTGEKNSEAKITDKDALEIRNLYSTGNFTYVALGLKFRLSRSQIWRVLKRKCWKHLK